MQLSVWEKESFFAPADCLIIGSGFAGLWSAYWLKKKSPKSRVTILERGTIPTGASTRNAGFACFGSITELLFDGRTMGLDNMLEMVEMRYRGIERIRKIFKKKTIDLEIAGGYDLLTDQDASNLPDLKEQIKWLNNELKDVIGEKKVFSISDSRLEEFGLSGFSHLVENRHEGQLHSGKLAQCLMALVQGMGVTILTNMEVQSIEPSSGGYRVNLPSDLHIESAKVLVCTNAFVKQLLPEIDITPARGQVLVTSPIKDLKLQGTFHYDHGYYYFRNLGNRVLLGGARNKAFEEETTTEMVTTTLIQEELEKFLATHILNGKEYTITDRWSGIMAMGPEKLPVIRQISPGLFCAVRMSGMGVALSPVAGEIIAAQIL